VQSNKTATDGSYDMYLLAIIQILLSEVVSFLPHEKF
jgi:hypothetical protein